MLNLNMIPKCKPHMGQLKCSTWIWFPSASHTWDNCNAQLGYDSQVQATHGTIVMLNLDIIPKCKSNMGQLLCSTWKWFPSASRTWDIFIFIRSICTTYICCFKCLPIIIIIIIMIILVNHNKVGTFQAAAVTATSDTFYKSNRVQSLHDYQLSPGKAEAGRPINKSKSTKCNVKVPW